MKFSSDKQRRAIFARLKQKLTEKTWLRRAAVGAALVGAGAAISYKYPKAQLLSRALMGAGAAGALGAGEKAYASAKDRAQHVATSARTAGHVGRAYAGALVNKSKDLIGKGVEGLRNAPVESAVGHLVDLPFAGLEARLHALFAKHAGNLSELAASKIGGISGYTQTKAGAAARAVHTKLLQVKPDRAAAERAKQAAVLQSELARITGNRPLRTDVIDLKFRKATMGAMQEMLRTGQLDWNPTAADMERWLRQQNIPITDLTRKQMRRSVAIARFVSVSDVGNS